MTDQYVAEGNTIPVAGTTGAKTEGGIARLDEIAGVYVENADSGAAFDVALEGVFTVTKATGAATALSVGEKVYATTTPAATPVTGASNLPLGIATVAAATGATTCTVKLCTF